MSKQKKIRVYESPEAKAIIKTIPKEHHKSVRKLMEMYLKQGENNVLYIAKQLGEIEPGFASEHGVVHDSDMAGG